MELRDFVTAIGVVISALLVIGGWFFNRIKDREQEKFKIRQSRREELVKTFLKLDEVLLRTRGKIEDNSDFPKYWLELAGLMPIYGTKSENKALQDFSENFLGPNNNIDKANTARNKLKGELTGSVRRELGLDPL